MSGSLIAEYILREKKEKGELPENAAIVETIVTTDMLKAVAEKYGVKLIEVLTGFKFIGEQIKLFEQNNSYEYIFGMEESYGCLAGTYARDKDACVAVMMLCEVAAYYKLKGMTLCDAMQDMREKRENPIQTIGGFKVLKMRDYLIDEVKDMVTGEKSSTGLPKSNVLYYELENNAWCCVRPSGTEPKIKFYYGVKGEDISDAVKKLEAVKADLL